MTRYYVNKNGETGGPFDKDQLVEAIRAGKMEAAKICAVGEDEWTDIHEHPLFSTYLSGAQLPPPPPPPPVAKPRPKENHSKRQLGALAIGGLAVIGAIAFFVSSNGEDAEKIATPSAPDSAAEPPPPPSPGDEIMTKTTLPGAIAFARELMGNSKNEMSLGAAILARWSVEHLRWQDLEPMVDSAYKEVAKDPAAFRGEKLCNRGRIIQISTDRSLNAPLYVGLMSGGWARNLTYFVAVGSSSGVVEGATVRYCGIVTGRYTYDSSDGGFRHAINSIGMFDIPANSISKEEASRLKPSIPRPPVSTKPTKNQNTSHLLCCDGTVSPTCKCSRTSRSGCCANSGGVCGCEE